MDETFKYNIETRISILECQVSNLTEYTSNINRKLSHETFLKQLIYYIIVGIFYYVNKELGSNINLLKTNNWQIFNIIVCFLLVILRRPAMSCLLSTFNFLKKI